jgi:hypothetical protein
MHKDQGQQAAIQEVISMEEGQFLNMAECRHSL